MRLPRSRPRTRPHPALRMERLEDRSLPAGTYTGAVFQDFNGNGLRDLTSGIANASAVGTVPTAVDRGLAGVTITVFDAGGTARGTAVTDAAGAFTVNATGTGPYRMEFTTLPAGFFPGAHGIDNASTVRFLPDGGAAGLNLGLSRPQDFSQDNPLLVTSCYVDGPFNGANANAPVIVGFTYDAGSGVNSTTAEPYNNPATHTLAVPHSAVGTTWGLGYRQLSQTIYAAAYMKKYTGFGPSGTGAIYRMGTTGSTASLFADLNAIFGAGTAGADPHNFNDPLDNGNTSWDAVGKTSLGGLDVSEDGSRVYVMNLADRQLYALGVDAAGAFTGTAYRALIPVAPGATGDTTGTNRGDLRPFAVQVFNGRIYVGMVNSAQTTGQSADLRAYVYEVTDNGTTLTFGATPVLNFSLAYSRGNVNPGISASWLPWVAAQQTIDPVNIDYPQPMLTGIAFDADGNMVLGFRDRVGDQTAGQDPPARGITAGDILRAAGSPALGWALESNGTAGGVTTAGAGNNQGPGGGEFYYQDNYFAIHDQTGLGGILQLPGFPQVLSTTFDPAYGATPPLGFNGAGVSWYSNATGQIGKAYQLFQGSSPFFSKANGLGDLIGVRTLAPVEVGNRVWRDVNGNGLQDANEAPIAGVTVRLYSPAGTVLATTTTNALGNYYFSSGAGSPTTGSVYNVAGLTPNTAGFTVRLDNPADAVAGGPLFGLNLSPANAGANDSIDSDGTAVGGFARTTVDTGGVGQNDHTADFGFVPVLVSLGNLVWRDDDNNGVQNGTEPGIANVPVELLDGAGNPVLDGGGNPITTTTDGNGNYLFPNLNPGVYRVRITPPPGFGSSTGTNGSATGPFEPGITTNQDSADHGTRQGNGTIRTAPVTLAVAGSASNPDTVNGEPNNANLRQDFGLFPTLSLGNLVWEDADNNGVLNGTEAGIANVGVELLTGNTVIATTTTNANGNYLFTNLLAGDYRVRITPPAGYVTSTGTNGSATGPFEPGASVNTPTDNDDNGTTNGTTIISGVRTLGVGTEPTGEAGSPGLADPALDANSNQTLDFGLFRPLSIGNVVWNDADNDGTFGGNETGIGNVAVRLLDQNGGLVASTTTNSGGGYLFTNLIPGQYQVEVTPPAGFFGSTGTGPLGNPTAGPFEPAPNNNVDNQDKGTLAGAVVRGPVITLQLGNQPTGEAATPGGIVDPALDANSNRTQDFGFYSPQLSLGNLVWRDDDNNGVQNGTEPGIANVPVELLDGAGNPVLDGGGNPITTTTDGNGNYLFPNLNPGVYRVRITPPPGFGSSTGTNGSATGPFEPGITTNQDSADHGTTSGTQVVAAPVTLAAAGSAQNPDNGGTANLRQDFGLFQLLSLGNLVWEDADNNGVRNGTEPGIANVGVALLTGNVVVATTTTNANGNYLFTNLLPGQYQVRITPPAGYISSTGTNGSATGPFEPGASVNTPTDNDDNGTAGGPGVFSGVRTLAFGTEPTGEAGSPGLTDSALDANSNQTIDFGLFRPLAVGNLVWRDGNNNGTVDAGEPGIPNVPVQLRDAGGTVVATTTTDPNGNYRFDNLAPGTYTVAITPPADCTSSTGTQGSPTGPYEPAPGPNNDIDNDDNGTTAGTLVVSGPVTLTVGGEPTNDGDGNANTNLTVDFGCVPIQQQNPPRQADVQVVKTVNAANTTRGAVVEYTFTVRNNGPDTATGVIASDPFPAGLTPVGPAIATQGSFNLSTNIWAIGTLALGATVTLRVPVRVDVTGTLVNTAVVGLNEFDPVLANNRSAVTVTAVLAPADVGKQEFLNSTTTTANLPPIQIDQLPPAVPAEQAQLAVGADAGNMPVVQVFDRATGSLRFSFLAYEPGFRGGVRVALGDINADGAQDIITAPGGGGGPLVKVFSGVDGSLLRSFFAFDSSVRGGLNVAAGDIDGDGRTDIVVGAGDGGAPHVKVFSGTTGNEIRSFFAYDSGFRNGVIVATGDVDGDGRTDIVTGAGVGGAPHVKVFSGLTGAEIRSYFAFDSTVRGGVYVGSGDVDGDGKAEVIAGAGVGGAPHVKVFSGATGNESQSVFAFDSNFRGGVRVAAADVTGDGKAEIVSAVGPTGAPRVRVFQAPNLTQLDDFFAFNTAFTGGITVAIARKV